MTREPQGIGATLTPSLEAWEAEAGRARATRVLLSMSEEALRIKYAMVLLQAGHALLEPAPGAALELARLSPPDAVLVDTRAQWREGWGLVRDFANEPSMAITPLVVLVDALDERNVWWGILLRCDALLPLPFDAEAVVEVLERLVERSRGSPPAGRGGTNGDQQKPHDPREVEPCANA